MKLKLSNIVFVSVKKMSSYVRNVRHLERKNILSS